MNISQTVGIKIGLWALLLVSLRSSLVRSEVLHIIPLAKDPCPVKPCLTLSRFAAESRKFIQDNMTLIFQPGNHVLKTNLVIRNVDNFSLQLYSSQDLTVRGKIVDIMCSKSKIFHLSRIDFIHISGLHFSKCGGNKVESVHKLVITDSKFQGEKEHAGSALILIGTIATIVKSEFTTYNGSLLQPFNKYNAGGAIVANNSNLTIFGSTFEGNIATYGGSIFASHYSNITIVNCTFNGPITRSKWIKFGGGMYIDSGVTVDIKLSNFDRYTATKEGGGVYACISSEPATLNIVSSQFHMCRSGAVYAAVNSQCYEAHKKTLVNTTASVNIVATTFSNNMGGAISLNMGDTGKWPRVSINVTGSYFSHNIGGAISTSANLLFKPSIQYTMNLTTSTFTHNVNDDNQFGGGAVCALNGDVLISGCNFTYNEAERGGAIFYLNSQSDGEIQIFECIYDSNKAKLGAAMLIETQGSFSVDKSNFSSGQSTLEGSAIYYMQLEPSKEKISNIKQSNFVSNTAKSTGGGGGATFLGKGSLNVIECFYDRNVGYYGGALLVGSDSTLTVIETNFTNNLANSGGALLASSDESDVLNVNILSSRFINNTATKGGAIYLQTCSVYSARSYFINNSAETGAILYLFEGSVYTNLSDIQAITNIAKQGLFYLYQSKGTFSGNSTLQNNSGSLFAFNSQLNLTETITIENGQTNHTMMSAAIEGGAITAFQSEINVFGSCILKNNQAVNGGAVLAIDSKLYVHAHRLKHGKHQKLTPTMEIINNTALDIGGGLYLYQSELSCLGQSNLKISGNFALNEGGGIYAISSIIIIFNKPKGDSDYETNYMRISENIAMRGGGIYVELTTKFYILEYQPNYSESNQIRNSVLFEANFALYGGALYVADETTAGTCKSTSPFIYSFKTECFIQSLMLYNIGGGKRVPINVSAVKFHENYAIISGSDLFGGLLDRCTVSPFAEIYYEIKGKAINGQSYFLNISTLDKQDQNSISSFPVRVCLCRNGKPYYGYQYQSIEVQKGDPFTIELAAIDQLKNLVQLANIRSVLNYTESNLVTYQVTNHSESCKAISFSITTPHEFEQLSLYAEGPCKNANLSTLKIHITFKHCHCLIGFQPNYENENTTCECVCDQRLYPYITKCHYNNKTVERQGNYWITNVSSHAINGSYNNYYSIYPNCPYDYCMPPNVIVFINFTAANGTDAQCANGRNGLLCGTCKPDLSLSLGSTRCIKCPFHWPVIMASIIVAAIVGGIVLVALVLLLNMTVAVGTLNGIIFYANIVAADLSTFLSSTTTRFTTVFISWLNLDIGIDTCFFQGMDTYWKALLQLAFPIYLIFLVFMIVLLSQLSNRFARLIGRKNPVATLGTMILLSYTKLLQTVLLVGTPAFASMTYPDGSIARPWLPEASIKYFSGKHIILSVICVVILFVGVAYTILLTFWQCLIKWIKNPRLCNFMEQYQAPYTPRHRYWTGMLLLVRVTLYIIISVVNVTNDPAINLLAIGLAMTLLIIHAQRSNPIYRRSPLEILEMLCYMNLLVLCLITFYFLEAENNKTAVTYVSTVSVAITIVLLLVVLCYHVYIEILIKVLNWLRMRGENGIHYDIQNNLPDIPQPEDEVLLQAADRGRRNETPSQRMEIDNHNNTVTY